MIRNEKLQTVKNKEVRMKITNKGMLTKFWKIQHKQTKIAGWLEKAETLVSRVGRGDQQQIDLGHDILRGSGNCCIPESVSKN